MRIKVLRLLMWYIILAGNCQTCEGRSAPRQWEAIRFDLRKGRAAPVPCMKSLIPASALKGKSMKRCCTQERALILDLSLNDPSGEGGALIPRKGSESKKLD